VDTAGTIDKLGESVKGWKEGDRVYCHISYAGGSNLTFAEYCTVNSLTISRIDDSVDWFNAAAIPCAGWTAYEALYGKARPREGETILITAGSGGVGGFAIQLAKRIGLNIITTSSSKNTEFVKSLGAHHAIDYTTEDIDARIKEITNGRGVDIWFDTLSPESAAQGAKSIAFGGQLVMVSGKTLPTDVLTQLLSNQQSVHGVSLGMAHRADIKAQKHLAEIGDHIMEMLKGNQINPMVSQVIPWTEIPTALETLKGGHVRGKIVAKFPPLL